MRILVRHTGYGCDTGCCGHVIEIDGAEATKYGFDFGHADDETPEALREYARELITREMGAAHVADIDWDGCEISGGERC